MKYIKYIIRWILLLNSIPFFVIGFIVQFMLQGIQDGRDLEKALEDWWVE